LSTYIHYIEIVRARKRDPDADFGCKAAEKVLEMEKIFKYGMYKIPL